MAHCPTVHLPPGALLIGCSVCGTGECVAPPSQLLAVRTHVDRALRRSREEPSAPGPRTVHRPHRAHLPSVHTADAMHRVWWHRSAREEAADFYHTLTEYTSLIGEVQGHTRCTPTPCTLH